MTIELALLIVSGSCGVFGFAIGVAFFLSEPDKQQEMKLKKIVENAPYHRLRGNLKIVE